MCQFTCVASGKAMLATECRSGGVNDLLVWLFPTYVTGRTGSQWEPLHPPATGTSFVKLSPNNLATSTNNSVDQRAHVLHTFQRERETGFF